MIESYAVPLQGQAKDWGRFSGVDGDEIRPMLIQEFIKAWEGANPGNPTTKTPIEYDPDEGMVVMEIDGPPAVHGAIRAWLATKSIDDLAAESGKPILKRLPGDARCPVEFLKQRPSTFQDGKEIESHRIDEIAATRRPKGHMLVRLPF